MNSRYGLRTELRGYPWKDVVNEFEKDGIKFKIERGVMEIGYDKEEDGEKARKMAQIYIDAYNLRSGKKITVDFYHTWKPGATSSVDHKISLDDTVNLVDRVQAQIQTHDVTIPARAYIVNQQMHDSAGFSNNSSMVDRALKDEVLEKALRYFSEEVVDNNRPLYGVYKAIEVITKSMGKDGRKALGALAGESEKYVTDLIQTTQLERHAVTDAKRLIEDSECKKRAAVLIEAYANSVKLDSY